MLEGLSPEYLERLKVKFWSRVIVIDDENSCWEWTGGTTGKGYGCYAIKRKAIGAHRFSYRISKGKIPKGLLVRHKCDNRRCVRPDHLLVGTQKDNALDAVTRNRCPKGNNHVSRTNPSVVLRGSRCGSSKLVESQVLEIRRLRQNGMSSKELSRIYKVGVVSINRIISRRSWAHI